MAYTVKFDTEDIATKAGNALTTAGNIEQELSRLNSQMAELQSSYTGTASEAFQEVYKRWQTTANQMKEELSEISRGLTNTGTARDDQEQSLTSQWRSAL